jgi:serine/threonine-protein kinase
MEWLPQAQDRVLRAQYPEPLAPNAALRLARGVAAGLAAVHAAGVVHRDVKPSNILLRADGSPVLTDFGLAAALAAVQASQRLTPSNVIVGTADYLAPEHIASGTVGGRTDIYSLGVVLYEMLAGYAPFAGRDPLKTLQAHLDEPPPPLPSTVPPAARAVVERALQKRPADRFASAEAVLAALDEALGEEG